MLLGYEFGHEKDITFWDKAEEIPDGYIIDREIDSALNGKDFFFNDEDTGKPVRCEGISHQDFNYYYVLWDDWHYLKILPHGKGTLSERRWLLNFLKIFDKTFSQITNLIDKKMQRNIDNNGKRNPQY